MKKVYADNKALKASPAESEDMPAKGIDSDYEDYSEFDSIHEIQEEKLFLTKKDGKIYYEFETGGYLTGWKTIDQNEYYFKKNGEAATKNITIGNLKYKFNSNGVCEGLFKGWTKKSGKYYYYKDGKMLKSCWLMLNGKKKHTTSEKTAQEP